MVEIIPNWHPTFVQFTVALFSASVFFSILSYLFRNFSGTVSSLVLEFESVGRWNLWMTAVITLGTVLAGLYAYFTVAHDTISHSIMTLHRNWAIITVAMILILTAWSLWNYFQDRNLTLAFIVCLLIGQVLVLTTAWYGNELVFRYGIGVRSLPQEEKTPHHHHDMLKSGTENEDHEANHHHHH